MEKPREGGLSRITRSRRRYRSRGPLVETGAFYRGRRRRPVDSAAGVSSTVQLVVFINRDGALLDVCRAGILSEGNALYPKSELRQSFGGVLLGEGEADDLFALL